MNTNPTEAAALSACARLQLTPEQITQQADLCSRLLHMAVHGVPTPGDLSPVNRPVLSLHALLTAVLALGATNREVTDEASRLCLAFSHELTLQHELHLQDAAARVLAEATFKTSAQAAPAATH